MDRIDKTMNKIERLLVKAIPAFLRRYVEDRWGISGTRKYAKNTAWMLAGQATTAASFVANIVIARKLGPESFGTLNYILAFVGVFGFVATIGINEVLVRELAKHPDRREALISSSTRMLIVSGLTATIFSAAMGLFSGTDIRTKSLIALFATSFLWVPINIVVSSHFYATVASKRMAITQFITTIVVTTARLIAVFETKSLLILTATYAFEPAISATINLFHARAAKLRLAPFSAYDARLAKILLKDGLLLTLSGAATYLLLRIDQVMVKSLLNSTAVGLYSAAVRLSELWYFLPGIICSSLFPAIVNSHGANAIEYRRRMKQLYVLLAVLAFGLSFIVSITAPKLVSLLYGDRYLAAIPILRLYAWSNIGFFLSTGLYKQLITERKQFTLLAYNIFAVFANIALNFLLIPKIGTTGAAWATLISYSVPPIFAFIMASARTQTNTNQLV